MPFLGMRNLSIAHNNAAPKNWGFTSSDSGADHLIDLNAVVQSDDQDSSDMHSHGCGKAKLCARGHWRPAKDTKLKELVALYGPQNWNLIAEKLDGRSGKNCRLRWFNQLDPRINRRAFTEEEEERLMAAHRLYGNKWAMIARRSSSTSTAMNCRRRCRRRCFSCSRSGCCCCCCSPSCSAS